MLLLLLLLLLVLLLLLLVQLRLRHHYRQPKASASISSTTTTTTTTQAVQLLFLLLVPLPSVLLLPSSIDLFLTIWTNTIVYIYVSLYLPSIRCYYYPGSQLVLNRLWVTGGRYLDLAITVNATGLKPLGEGEQAQGDFK